MHLEARENFSIGEDLGTPVATPGEGLGVLGDIRNDLRGEIDASLHLIPVYNSFLSLLCTTQGRPPKVKRLSEKLNVLAI